MKLGAVVGLLGAVLALATAPEARADVDLPAVFGRDMVLQRDRPLPIWGTAKPREEVTVAIAGQSKTVRTDAAPHVPGRAGNAQPPIASD